MKQAKNDNNSTYSKTHKKLVIAEKPSVAQSIAKVSVDATIVADHIVLEAEDLGLSSCWLTYLILRLSEMSLIFQVTLNQ